MTNPMSDRPGLSVWVRLMKVHGLILRQARRSIGPDLTLPRFDVMAQIARDPDGLTFVELSRRLLVTAGNLTGIVDRLERDGLVAREAHETDGRARRIRLTGAGRRMMTRLLPRHARDIDEMMGGMSRSDLERLRCLLGRLLRGLEERHVPEQMVVSGLRKEAR
jgi:DNA-binding MarR family transcriptional regulator